MRSGARGPGGRYWGQGGPDSRGWEESSSQTSPHAPLQDDEEVSEFALDGLKQVMAIKSRVVLPYLVPKVSPHTWRPPLARQP